MICLVMKLLHIITVQNKYCNPTPELLTFIKHDECVLNICALVATGEDVREYTVLTPLTIMQYLLNHPIPHQIILCTGMSFVQRENRISW